MRKTNISVAGCDIQVAPLTLKQIRELVIEPSEAHESDSQMNRHALEMCAASIANAGGTITVDQLEGSLTVGDFKRLIQAVREVSELVAGGPKPAAD